MNVQYYGGIRLLDDQRSISTKDSDGSVLRIVESEVFIEEHMQ